MKRCDISSNFFSNVKFDPHQFPWPLTKKKKKKKKKTLSPRNKKHELDQAYAKFRKKEGRFRKTSK